MREEVDYVIKNGWDEVEFYYRNLKDEKMRKEAMYFGVIYYSRPGEKPEDGVLEEEPEV